MRFAVTSLFVLCLAAGSTSMASWASQAKDRLSEWRSAQGAELRKAYAAVGGYKPYEPVEVHRDLQLIENEARQSCDLVWTVATLGSPFLAFVTAWLVAVWGMWLAPERRLVRSSVKGSMRGAFSLPVAVLAVFIITGGWSGFVHKFGTDIEDLLFLILATANGGALAGLLFGLAWVTLKRGAIDSPAGRHGAS